MVPFGLCAPGALPVELAGEDALCDDYVFSDLEVEHSGADKVGAVFVGVLEGVSGVDGAGGHNLVCNPGFLDALHKLCCFFGRFRPGIVVLRLPSRRPVVVAVQGLHIEIEVEPGLLAGYGDFDTVASDARERPVLLNVVNGFAEEIDPAAGYETIGYAAVDIDPDRPVIDGRFGLGRGVVGSHLDLGDPLELSASVVPVLVDDPDAVVVEP